MKNYLVFTTLLFAFSCSIVTENENLVIGNEDYFEINNPSQLKKIEDYYYLGDIHNEYMQNIHDNFTVKEFESFEEVQSVIKEFHLNFTPQDTIHNSAIKNEFQNEKVNWELLDHKLLKADATAESNIEVLNLGVELGLMDSFEKELLLELAELSNSNLSFEQLNDFLDLKINEWNNRGYANGGESSSTSNGVSVVAGAVIGSTGLVGRAARGIVGWLG
jgi:hypothetical protein